MTVRQNLAFPLQMAKTPIEEQNLLIQDVASTLDLLPFIERKPAQLSGGQRQRVAIGRAIVRKPRAFLFDEPLSSLDAELRVNMRLEIANLHRKLDTTTIYVTHDQVEAMTLADRIVVLNNGEIEQVGTPSDIYQKPINTFVAGFIGSPKMNFIDGDAASEFEADTIGIRPEHLQVDKEKGKWFAEIIHYEDLGAESYIYLSNKTIGKFTLQCEPSSNWKVGNSVYITPQVDHVHRFDKSGNRVNKQ
jgi:multiple sugar transport system ATP-binding protein